MIVKVIRLHKNEQNEEEPKKKGKKKRKVRIKKTNRVGIDLGSGKNYATVYFSRKNKIKIYENFLYNEENRKIFNKMNKLKSKKILSTQEIFDIDDYEKILSDNCHKMINRIIKDIIKHEPDIITIENINVEAMKYSNLNNVNVKNSRLLNAFIDASEFEYFKKAIKEKCKKNHIRLQIADSKFPSTKICNVCGHWNNVKKEKIFICKHCGSFLKRDENSAIILSEYNLDEFENYYNNNSSKKYYK